MTIEKCYNDLKEIFSKPCAFSKEIEEGHSYIPLDDGHRFMVVSRKWGYWLNVMETLQKYFNENGNLDDGAGLIPSKTDMFGTTITLCTKEELQEYIKQEKDENNKQTI